jgi:multiple sugar transport system permease protein
VAGAAALLVAAARLLARSRKTEGSRGTGAVAWALFGLGAAAILAVLPRVWSSGDAEMMDSLRVTVWYSAGTVPVQLGLGLLLAVVLDAKFRGKQAFRVIFLLPYVVPAVASATVFERLFSLRPESFANQAIALLGMPPLQWLRETRGVLEMALGWGRQAAGGASAAADYWLAWARGPSLALVSVMFFNYWVFIGYYALIYSNGLANIPREFYEAAQVDGARKGTVFFRIVLPLLSPTTFFLSLLGVIGTFKAFNHIYVLRNADAQGAADPVSVYIFFTFFRMSRFGYAAALALVLFAIVMGLTWVERRMAAHRVFYGED